MNLELLEQQLTELPLYIYAHIDPQVLEFSDRIRFICQNECPMYGQSWACPPVWVRWPAARENAAAMKNAC